LAGGYSLTVLVSFYRCVLAVSLSVVFLILLCRWTTVHNDLRGKSLVDGPVSNPLIMNSRVGRMHNFPAYFIISLGTVYRVSVSS